MVRKSLVLGVLLAVSGAALALINPNFTPKHLVEQSDLIVAGKLKAGDKPTVSTIVVENALTGEAGKEIVLDLSQTPKDRAADIQKAFKDNAGDPVVLYSCQTERGQQAFLHLAGMWFSVKKGENGQWLVTNYAIDMSGTYAGGTDKLIEMSAYLVKDPEADVPITANVNWLDHAKLCTLKGDIAGLAGVEVGKQGHTCLFVGAAEGDRLFVPKKGQDALEEGTAASKLLTKSRRFTFVDVNADGLGDLVSYDGQNILVRLNGKDGVFTDAGAGFVHKLQSDCLALTPCSANDGKPGVLVSTHSSPLLLVVGEKGWTPVKLPDPATAVHMGQPSACIVADLDRDGCADILQPAEQGSLLWKGKAGGFDAPVKSNIAALSGQARTAVADFDEDGYLDIFLVGGNRNSLWESDGKGGLTFTEVFNRSGSMSYKCPAGANDVQAVDLNHDGRTDLCLLYDTQDILYHWNRGFRSFGEEGEVRLPGTAVMPGQQRTGQKTMTVADFNKDNSRDLVVAMTNGDLYVYFNDKMSMPAVNLRLPKGAVGPVTAECLLGEKDPTHTGVAIVSGHSPATYQAIRYPGTVTIKYRYPGKAAQTVKVKVEDGAKDVVLENK